MRRLVGWIISMCKEGIILLFAIMLFISTVSMIGGALYMIVSGRFFSDVMSGNLDFGDAFTALVFLMLCTLGYKLLREQLRKTKGNER